MTINTYFQKFSIFYLVVTSKVLNFSFFKLCFLNIFDNNLIVDCKLSNNSFSNYDDFFAFSQISSILLYILIIFLHSFNIFTCINPIYYISRLRIDIILSTEFFHKYSGGILTTTK